MENLTVDAVVKIGCLLVYFSFVGVFQNLQINTFKNLCQRLTGDVLEAKMNFLLSSLSFHCHLILGSYIIIYTIFIKKIKWCNTLYTCENGKVVLVQRNGVNEKTFE
jgi:hypothetical protein